MLFASLTSLRGNTLCCAGRKQVAASAKFKRLAFVSLNCDHEYSGMKEIQDELSSKVMELAPSNLPRNYKAR